MADREALLAELDAAHDAFLEALADVDADLATVSGVMDDWSVRDIVVHVAAWNEHGTDALALAASGRGADFAYSKADTDAMNARFLTDGRAVSAREALRREEASFRTFRAAVATLEPSLFEERLGSGDTVEEVVRYDGPDHYAEHTGHVRSWFQGEPDGDGVGDG